MLNDDNYVISEQIKWVVKSLLYVICQVVALIVLAGFMSDKVIAKTISSDSIQEGRILATDGVELYYIKIGNSSSSIIIPNGLYLFEDFKFLAKQHTVVFYDLRNRGRSTPVYEPESLKDGIHNDVKDLEAVRRFFKLSKPNIIGHSYLGLMVILYALENAKSVNRIIQIDALGFETGKEYPKELTANENMPVPSTKELERLKELENMEYSDDYSHTYCNEWWSIIRKVFVTNPNDIIKIRDDICNWPNEWPSRQMHHLSNWIFPSIQSLDLTSSSFDNIRVPVLNIHGKKDRVVPYGVAIDWVNSLKNARLVTIDNGGHLPWIEDPDMVFNSILDFLSSQNMENMDLRDNIDIKGSLK